MKRTKENDNNNIVHYVDWINQIFKKNSLQCDLYFLDDNKEKDVSKKRKAQLKGEYDNISRNKENMNNCKKIKNELSIKDNMDDYIYDARMYNNDEEKNVIKSDFKKNDDRNACDIYKSNKKYVPDNCHIYDDNSLVEILDGKNKLNNIRNIHNDNSSSCDISDIKSEDEYIEAYEKKNEENINEYKNKKNISNENITEGKSLIYNDEYNYNSLLYNSCNDKISKINKISSHNNNDNNMDNYNTFANVNNFIIYSSDDEDNILNYYNGKDVLNDEIMFPIKFNFEKLKKNIYVIEHIDKIYYDTFLKKNPSGKSVFMNDESTGYLKNDMDDKCVVDNINVINPSNMNTLSNISNIRNEKIENNKKNEKLIKSYPTQSKNVMSTFSFWNIEKETFITKPLYAHNLRKKQFSLLDESEEMIRNYSSNQYSIKFVPRHLLYVMSQVASRSFFDPLYRKQLFFRY
ncbi:hypothetical protein PRSY57_0202300 [Plasmodium reichenowi]|uniref:Uncharacterized protein n=1 Tax=Plasmodium reichenowi TaxID=5854 RepID=A0A151LUV2_PLARE|nr:hypothetical protein PRSY57_0202300 [Plasmodium reichenowi]KYO02952.1 hypothetical protein PRSY57_0202300 [Plasmodium reichenowi]